MLSLARCSVRAVSYFSPTAKGGSTAAKLMHQGPVAALLAAELLIDPAAVHPAGQPVNDWAIRVEQGEDLIVGFNDNAQLFVQVKDEKLGRPALAAIFTHWDSLSKSTPGATGFRLHALAGLIDELSALPSDLDVLRERLATLPPPHRGELQKALGTHYNLGVDIHEGHHIDVRPVRNDTIGRALFAGSLRRVNDTRMLSETTAGIIFGELATAFNALIHSRGAMDRSDVLAILERLLVRRHPADGLGPYAFVDPAAPDRGYRVDPDAARQLQRDAKIVRSATAGPRRRWMRHQWPRALLGLVFGRWEPCPVCGHPMMANCGGLGGLACPDCGAFLHLTLAVACDCGELSIIAEQPPPREEELGRLITDFVSQCRQCRQCQRTFDMERCRDRWFVAPLPAQFLDRQNGVC